MPEVVGSILGRGFEVEEGLDSLESPPGEAATGWAAALAWGVVNILAGKLASGSEPVRAPV
jgi:hypothetical protein